MPGLETRTGQVSDPRRGGSQPQGPGWRDSGGLTMRLCRSAHLSVHLIGSWVGLATLQEERAGGSQSPQHPLPLHFPLLRPWPVRARPPLRVAPGTAPAPAAQSGSDGSQGLAAVVSGWSGWSPVDMLSSGPRCGLRCGGAMGAARATREDELSCPRHEASRSDSPAQAQEPGRGLAPESRCLCGLLRGCGGPHPVSPPPPAEAWACPEASSAEVVSPEHAQWLCCLQAHGPRWERGRGPDRSHHQTVLSHMLHLHLEFKERSSRSGHRLPGNGRERTPPVCVRPVQSPHPLFKGQRERKQKIP